MSQTSTLLPTSSRVIAWPSASPISSPFGSSLPNRAWSDVSRVYRYGFNGKEKDTETANDNYDFGARVYDGRLGRWLSLDPHLKDYSNISPYQINFNCLLVFKDELGKDAIVVIKDNVITISTTIFIYGDGATQAVANQMQTDIMNAWSRNNNKDWTYTDSETKEVYTVKFDVKVKLYEGVEKNDPLVIEETWDTNNRDNFIEVDNDCQRSEVVGGDEGTWRGTGRDGKSLAQDDPAPHEFGHLVGLTDRYDADGKGPFEGWKGNIMAEPANKGKVEQKNIDGIVSKSVTKLNNIKKYGNQGGNQAATNKVMQSYGYDKSTNTYNTSININNPTN